MRKLLLLSTVFVLSMSAFDVKDANAQRASDPNLSRIGTNIVSEINDGWKTFVEEFKKGNEQNTAGQAVVGSQNTSALNGVSQNFAGTVKQNAIAASAMRMSNVSDIACPHISISVSFSALYEYASNVFFGLMAANSALLNGSAGQPSQNGATDMGVLVYDEMQGQCGNDGGNPVLCPSLTGATLLANLSLSPEDVAVNRIKDKMVVQAFTSSNSSNPAKYDNPTTDTKNEVVKENALTYLASMATTTLGKIEAFRTASATPPKAREKMVEMLKAGGANSDEYIETLLPANGASMDAFISAYGQVQLNPEVNKQDLFLDPEKLILHAVTNLKMQSFILTEMYKMMRDASALDAGKLLLEVDKTKENLNAQKAGTLL